MQVNISNANGLSLTRYCDDKYISGCANCHAYELIPFVYITIGSKQIDVRSDNRILATIKIEGNHNLNDLTLKDVSIYSSIKPK